MIGASNPMDGMTRRVDAPDGAAGPGVDAVVGVGAATLATVAVALAIGVDVGSVTMVAVGVFVDGLVEVGWACSVMADVTVEAGTSVMVDVMGAPWVWGERIVCERVACGT